MPVQLKAVLNQHHYCQSPSLRRALLSSCTSSRDKYDEDSSISIPGISCLVFYDITVTYVAAAIINSIVLDLVNKETTRRYDIVAIITIAILAEIVSTKLQTITGINSRSVIKIKRSALAIC